jgi:iron complex outermembrane receptor protein/vitamin B12 transporter
MIGTRRKWFLLYLSAAWFLCAGVSWPATLATLRGSVSDSLSQPIGNAKVTLFLDGAERSVTQTDSQGQFEFSSLNPGRYSVRVEAPRFSVLNSDVATLGAGVVKTLNLSLTIGTLPQRVVVSATGSETRASQVGASVDVVDRDQLDDLAAVKIDQGLRALPGVQFVQSGPPGSTTALFVRGGNSDFNKVLIDGIPVNDIGGAVEFANLESSGVEQVEILRDPNSVIYGTDALSSVINITSRHGTSEIPEIRYSGDGGNFNTYRNDGSIAGAYRSLDYFSEFTGFDTRNGTPNSAFHDTTYAGNAGWKVNNATSIRFTVRHTTVDLGDPNALDFYGIADKSSQRNHNLYWGLTLQNQTTPRWHNLFRFASTTLNYAFIDPSPSGTPFDPFAGTPYDTGPNYLGDQVTIRGANGYSASGQAILDYAGVYPETYNTETTRRSFYAQSEYQIHPQLAVTGGFRYEYENGIENSGGFITSTDRNNYNAFSEANGNLGHRLFANAGVGFDHNAVFGFAATPRVSAAYYLRRPQSGTAFNETKLKFNFGKGIKEPSITDQSESLYTLLLALPGGSELIKQYGIAPIGAERSRNFDFGIDQGLWGDRARFGISLFQENFYDLIEYVDAGVLPQLGVPASVAAASGFGATINSDSFKAKGAEFEFNSNLGHGLHIQAAYTYLDAVVTKSFTGSAVAPAFNPDFPTIPIGAYAPLVGARPFDRAPHSGSVIIDYTRKRFGTALSGYFVGRRDGSTFLSDDYEGYSLLLPNRNLQASYQTLDWSGRYTWNRHLESYFAITNLLSAHYQEEFGYPSLPLAFRLGIRVTILGPSDR